MGDLGGEFAGGLTLGDPLASQVPWRAFLAWVERGVLPVGGGVLDQPHALWRTVEMMEAGYRRAKGRREAMAAQAQMDAVMRVLGGR